MDEDWLGFAAGRFVIGAAISAAIGTLIATISIYQIVMGTPDLISIPQNPSPHTGWMAAGLCGVAYACVGRSTPSPADVNMTMVFVMSWILLETMVIAVIVLPLCITKP